MSDNNSYTDILLEQIRDQNKAILEAVSDMQKNVASIPSLQKDVTVIKDDVMVIKAAVTATNKDLQLHEQRITAIESAT